MKIQKILLRTPTTKCVHCEPSEVLVLDLSDGYSNCFSFIEIQLTKNIVLVLGVQHDDLMNV